MPFLPREHPIPAGFEGPRFKARPITVNDVVKDYDAVMIDLAWHQPE